MVCAAFMTATNAGSIEGCELEEFLTRFVAELIDPGKKNYSELQTVEKIKWGGSFRPQFMLPFNTSLEPGVQEKLSLVESIRPSSLQMFDAGTILRTGPKKDDYTIKCMVEVKSSTNPAQVLVGINEALKRQDSNAKVSFIIVAGTVASIKNFALGEFEVRDRTKRVHRKFAYGESLTNSQLFKVQVDDTNRVTLTALALDNPNADRVIFLISAEDINAQCGARQ
jgi:hypothetical protein